jgi:hypothetical protein
MAPAASLLLAGGLSGFFRCFHLTAVGNGHTAFREMRDDCERATHGVNEAPQIADVHICPVFHLGDSRLMDLKPCGQIRLRLLARFPLTGGRALRLTNPGQIRLAAWRQTGHRIDQDLVGRPGSPTAGLAE